MSDLPKSSPDLHKNTNQRALMSSVNHSAEETYVIVFHLKTGAQAQFLTLLEPVLDAMRDESTFINAVLHRDPASDNTFMLYETWSDHDDVINVQQHRSYRKAFWNTLPELLAQPRQIQIWKPVRTDVTSERNAG